MSQESLKIDQQNQIEFVKAWRLQLELNFVGSSYLFGDSYLSKQRFYSWFESLPLDKQEQISRSSLGATFAAVPGEISQEKELTLLRQFLFRYGMGPLDSSVYEQMDKEDVIEVYDSQGIQIYRSWSFFKFCRYTIDQVLSNSWDELYTRPAEVERKLYSLIP